MIYDMKRHLKSVLIIIMFFIVIINIGQIGSGGIVNAQSATLAPYTIPKIGVSVDAATSPKDTATSVEILLLLTVLSLAPSILIMMTSFTKIIIVLSFLRNAMGTQQTPPNQVLVGLALFMTLFIMAPVGTQINNNAVQPYLNGKINQTQAFSKAEVPIKKFMLRQTRKSDLSLFITLSKEKKIKRSNIPLTIVIPSFIISQLKDAFEMGFLIFIPFLIIDMVVASTLMSMGMMMLPPSMISLPFKILLFVMVDGWSLIIQSIVSTFR
jgi:flagellar biosynthetic protein FliP